DSALRPARGEPQRSVGVVTEVEMVSGEAGVDVNPLLGLRVVVRDLAQPSFLRRDLRRRTVPTLLAAVGVRRRTDARAEPRTHVAIHHSVVDARMAVPDRVLAPVG